MTSEARTSVITSPKPIVLRVSPPSVIQDEDRAAFVVGRAVEIDAERVVHRGLAVRLAAADPLDHAREVLLAVLRDAHLGVEVDERHVLGVAAAC